MLDTSIIDTVLLVVRQIKLAVAEWSSSEVSCILYLQRFYEMSPLHGWIFHCLAALAK